MKKLKIPKSEAIFVLLIFFIILAWAMVQPFDVSPDERMRYTIVQYIVEHWKLPAGYDPEIRDASWGISYAFNPILAYMIMAVFAKVASFFTDNYLMIVKAARLVNVLLGAGTAFVLLRIGRYMFDKWGKWIFASLAMLLPGTVFVFSYVNNDGLAIFSVALMILFWVRSMKEGWTMVNCIGLAIAIGVCALAYYNAYGAILASIIYFVISIILGGDSKGKTWNIPYLMKWGMLIVVIVLVIAGWWFVRSYLLYDGDFLGMHTSSMYAQKYGIEECKPTNRYYYSRSGNSILHMLFFVPEGWRHNWMITVAVSFVGTFGYLTVFMPYWLSKCYLLVFIIGMMGCLMTLRKLFSLWGRKSIVVKKKMNEDELVKMSVSTYSRLINKKALFHWCMVVTAVVPLLLLMYYAYCSDFQAQGRYLMPGLVAIMYFISKGLEEIIERIERKTGKDLKKKATILLIILLAAGMLFTFFMVFLPNYIIYL